MQIQQILHEKSFEEQFIGLSLTIKWFPQAFNCLEPAAIVTLVFEFRHKISFLETDSCVKP